ncbi:MAG: cytochrome c biogenesis protein CcdA [Anaerovoracaceae bacterium]
MGVETIYISTVFIAGIVSFFSPCIVPLLPVYFSIFASQESPSLAPKNNKLQTVLKSAIFVAGISLCFVLLGFGAGAFGQLINSKWTMIIVGGIVVALGIHQTGLINIKWLNYEKKIKIKNPQSKGYLSIFLLGLTFSFGWTPCIGPVLGAILGISAAGSQPLYGGLLMAVYSLGFLIPFLVLAIFLDLLLSKVKKINKYLGKIKIAGGIIIIIMGVLLMTDSLTLLIRIFE